MQFFYAVLLYIYTTVYGFWILIDFAEQFVHVVVFDAIKIRKSRPGLIIHSDKGSQMRSYLYRSFLSNHNFVFSYTELDHSCDQNAAQESFHASLKKQKLYQMKLYNYEDAYKAIYDYIEGFYNPTRLHPSIGYQSPKDFEKSCSLRWYPL